MSTALFHYLFRSVNSYLYLSLVELREAEKWPQLRHIRVLSAALSPLSIFFNVIVLALPQMGEPWNDKIENTLD